MKRALIVLIVWVINRLCGLGAGSGCVPGAAAPFLPPLHTSTSSKNSPGPRSMPSIAERTLFIMPVGM